MQHLITDCVTYWNQKKLRKLFTIAILLLITYNKNIKLKFAESDTQLADVRVTQQQYGQIPRCVRTLPQCLSIYLNLPENLICDGSIVSDSPQWNR